MMPKVFLVRQAIRHSVVSDAAGVAATEMRKCEAEGAVKPGDRVAIACGSRGIRHVGRIVKAVVDSFKGIGARPFVFPAMGCHGGGTSDGQKATLAHLGISEEKIGCPVLSEIEPNRIGPVYLDANACEADHLMVINRVKPHSDFFGTIGSGLLKMLAIGCGKMKGADAAHEAAITRGLEYVLHSVSAEVLKRAPVLGGLGVVEGPTGLVADVQWVPADRMPEMEPILFSAACRLAPAIPFRRCNLLAVEWMGKNISGCGMDPFVIGRQEYLNVRESYTDFKADRIYVGDMTDQSLGNADGIGMADATSQRLVAKLDYDAIRLGVLTSRTLPLGRIPVFFRNDRDALDALLGTTAVARKDASLVRIKNTTELEYMQISENLLGEWEELDRGEVVSGPDELPFDDGGNLLPISECHA